VVSISTKTRNIKFRLYPSRKQEQTLFSWLDLHRELYNAAIQERRDAWKKAGVSVRYLDQQNVLPEIKQFRPELVPLGSHALQETVRRVDRAFQAFFRRVRTGDKPGFPRFKSRNRFDSFTYPDPAGWKVLENKKRRGKLRIGNLGTIRMRGSPRVTLERGELRTLTVLRKNGKWYAAITVRCEDRELRRNPAPEGSVVGLDAGCKALVHTSDGRAVENPRQLSAELEELRRAQKDLSRKKRGSRNRGKARSKVSRIHELVANRRRDFLHKLSTELVSDYFFIVVEDLKLRNMSRSARGTVENPGRNVRQKAGLNRSLLDASVGRLYQMVAYKAEEAGGQLLAVSPHGTSQKCSRCGNEVAKDLSVRIHECQTCGLIADRDHNAAINILALGLTQAGRGPAEVWRGAELPEEARNRLNAASA
jgi:putative transposase